MTEPKGKQYRLGQTCYLRLSGGDPNPTLLEEGTIVGEGTPYAFEGPPSMGMIPLTEAAQSDWDDMMNEAQGRPPTVKNVETPGEGGATPFDPASGKKDSDVESGKAKPDPTKSDAAAAAAKK